MERNGDLGALAVGAPLGLLIHSHYGFAHWRSPQWHYPYWRGPVMAQSQSTGPGGRTSIAVECCRAYWKPGLGLALQGVGFAVIGTLFRSTLPAKDGRWRALLLPRWRRICRDACHVWLDAGPFWRVKVAIVSLLVETVGLLLLWQPQVRGSH